MTHVTSRSRPLLTSWLVVLVALALLVNFVSPAQAAGAWTATGPMVNGHAWHAMTLLADGRVLVTGGSDGWPGLAAAEIFNPTTGSWVSTGSMSVTRASHTLTLLNDGRVLAAGGVDNPNYTNVTYASAEIYDPTTGAWSPTGSMTVARSRHTATRLNDGRVLVVSGVTAEIYDPVTTTWLPTGAPSISRDNATATLLADGRVLLAGGIFAGFATLQSAELYDPATGTWSPTGNLNVGRWDFTATLLSTGQVLVTGGTFSDTLGNYSVLTSSEIYDPAIGAWISVNPMATPRTRHSATALTDGRILVAGGFSIDPTTFAGSILRNAEIFNPATGTWSAESSMISARNRHTAAALNDGRVLVVGGGGDGSGTCCAEVFSVTPPSTPSITVVAPNGGEIWKIGSTKTITWNVTGIIGNVTIQISRDGGANYTTIANNIANSGAFTWAVTGPATNQALIRVSSTSQPAVQDTSNNPFRIRR